MRIMPIASGSSGNCIYVGSDKTHILIDAGISRKRILDGLKVAGLDIKDISAILVTHEHSDHIKGIGVMSRKDGIPVYSTKGSLEGIKNAPNIGELDLSLFNEISPDCEFEIGDLCIHPFSISHDAKQPTAFSVKKDCSKITVATDLGKYDDYIVSNVMDSRAVLVESNHDVNLLQVGSYPYYLKQRILGNKGHLSNESCGRLIDRILNDDLKKIYLGHLSKENNYDKLAYETVRLEIDMSDSRFAAKDFDICVASRDDCSCITEI